MHIQKVKLNDLVVRLIDNRGKTPPLSDEGYELIETTSLVGDNKHPNYDLVNKHVIDYTYNTWFRAGHPVKNDILIATVGANIGSLIIMKENRGCVAQNLVGLRLNSRLVEPHFLYYFLNMEKTQRVLKNLDIGAAQPSIKVPHLLTVDVLLPPLPTQRKIAAILSAYDDLIENNLWRTRILKQIAQNLYTEWFVKFRFPGHEKVKMVDSPLGRIPEGWKLGKLGNIAHLVKEKYSDEYHSDLPLLDLSRIPRRSLAILEFGTPDELTTSRIISEKGDVLFGSIRPYFHKVVVSPCKLVTNISVFVIRAASIPQSFLVYLLFSDEMVAWASQKSGGTKMPVIKWDVLSNREILIPPNYILKDFESIISPIQDCVMTMILTNMNLHRTRDVLLPRLISGELDVSDLDIKTGDDE